MSHARILQRPTKAEGHLYTRYITQTKQPFQTNGKTCHHYTKHSVSASCDCINNNNNDNSNNNNGEIKATSSGIAP